MPPSAAHLSSSISTGVDQTRVPFYPHGRIDSGVRARCLERIDQLLVGPSLMPVGHSEIAGLETELAAWLGSPTIRAVGSGTAALAIAVQALDAPIGQTLLTSAFTYQATAAAAVRSGLIPRFADIVLETLLLDDDAAAAQIDERTAALVPVHLLGSLCEVPAARARAAHFGAAVITDSAQRLTMSSFLADDAEMVCYSLGPGKNIAGVAEGGAIGLANAALDPIVSRLRRNGSVGDFRHLEVGYNAVLSPIAAVALREHLLHVAMWNHRRAELAHRYDQNLNNVERLQIVKQSPDSSFSKYCVLVEAERDSIVTRLQSEGLEVDVHYPLPLHLQPCFAALGYGRGDFPNAERASASVISLPLHHALENWEVDLVCERLCACLLEAAA